MDRASAVVRRMFAAAAVAWAAMVPLAAYVAARPDPAAATSMFALTIYAVGSAVCHQRPERSFFLWERQLPVCARCTGIYLGAALVSIVALVRPAKASRSVSNPKTLIVIALIPLAATLIFEWTTGVTPNNWIRAATGVLAGAAVAWVVSK